MGVGQPANTKLNLFGHVIRDAFGSYAYHVGSSLRKKYGWRDVDVRFLMPDAEYDAMFGAHPDSINAKLNAFNLAFSELGKLMTGLPIDFQIQRLSNANKEFKGGMRSAVGVTECRLSRASSQSNQ